VQGTKDGDGFRCLWRLALGLGGIFHKKKVWNKGWFGEEWFNRGFLEEVWNRKGI